MKTVTMQVPTKMVKAVKSMITELTAEAKPKKAVKRNCRITADEQKTIRKLFKDVMKVAWRVDYEYQRIEDLLDEEGHHMRPEDVAWYERQSERLSKLLDELDGIPR